MSNTHKILVADDSLTIRKLVESVLSKEGYSVVTAVSGADCLAKATSEKPTLILLDYILPDMQGTEVCRSLINSPETWEIPVLMMSSNGTAIRQLYQDLNNVADYLTKPFAPSVLKAVIAQLLQKDQPAEQAEVPATPAAAPVERPAAPAQAEPAVPNALMDKVTRLLSLMENAPAVAAMVENPAKAPAAKEPAPAPAPAPAAAPAKKPRTRRAPRKAASPLVGDALLRKCNLVLKKHLGARLQQIPEWEAARGSANAEEFFIGRLLTKDLLQELSADLLQAAGVLAEAEGAWRSPSKLVPLDQALRHVHGTHATGELRIETAEETVLGYFENGKVALLTTNHPRHYCAGAAYDFQSLPHAAISEAVKAQENKSQPFFVTLHNSGKLQPGVSLKELLRVQGERCLARAFQARESVITFNPLAQLPPMALENRVDESIAQLLLGCYRSVDDWFTLEKGLPDRNATLVPATDVASEFRNLRLDVEESRILEALQPGRTISEVTEGSQLKPFEVNRILFRLLKLGLIRAEMRAVASKKEEVASRTSEVEEVVDEVNEVETSTTPEPVIEAVKTPSEEPLAQIEEPIVQTEEPVAQTEEPLAPISETVKEEVAAPIEIPRMVAPISYVHDEREPLAALADAYDKATAPISVPEPVKTPSEEQPVPVLESVAAEVASPDETPRAEVTIPEKHDEHRYVPMSAEEYVKEISMVAEPHHNHANGKGASNGALEDHIHQESPVIPFPGTQQADIPA
jgi:DNA-binding response OmpR family regulator